MLATTRVRAGIATVACACSGLVASGAQAAETGSQTFTTVGEHAFVVPAGVTSVQVTLVGGNGGAGKGGAPGGVPATVTATLAVNPGETLYAEVAGDGQPASGVANEGGYGGGASGGAASGFGGPGGGGGGGASDVRTCPASALPSACGGRLSLASRLIVAAGGGGGGGNGQKPSSTAGGNGGGGDQSGSPGHKDEIGDEGGSGGLRATLSAGGEAGGPNLECEPKTGERCALGGGLGNGGTGGSGVIGGGGGGGGGGVFGGGGGGGGAESKSEPANGGGGGGGGGSSGVPPGTQGVSGFSLVPTATGAEPSVALAWTMPPPAVLTGAPSALTSATATLNGTVNPDGSQVTECHFTITPAPSGGASIPCQQQVGAGSVPVAVSAAIAGLAPATTYTVTLTAASAQGSVSGAPVTFLTSASGSVGGSNAAAASALTVTNLKLSPTRFRLGKRAATLAKKQTLPSATTISLTLSQAATVALSFEQSRAGVLVGHKCVALSKSHRKGRGCTRYAALPHHVTLSAHAGADKIAFDGILDGGSRLAPGSYRLSLTASGAGGRATATQHPTFTLLA